MQKEKLEVKRVDTQIWRPDSSQCRLFPQFVTKIIRCDQHARTKAIEESFQYET